MKRLVYPGEVRAPRGRVLIDGKTMPGAKEVEVTSNGHYQADKWRVKLALNATGGKDLDWWGADDRKGMLVDCRMSLLGGDERSLILGEADRIDVHPHSGEVEMEGRDLTARLIESKTQETFQNETASEIATLLAGRHGLTPVVTATTTKVSRFYALDHDRMQHGQFSKAGTEWDLLALLARYEGFDAYVRGKELHFEKATDLTKAEPYGVFWHQDTHVSDMIKLDLGRSLTLAKDIVVIVRSWHSGAGRGFTKSSPAGRTMSKVHNGKAQLFGPYVAPNLTEDQAQKWAESIRDLLTKHERRISFDIPGELDLTPRDALALSGAGGWSQRYYVDTITRRVSQESGFVQSVTAKNHNTESFAS